MPARNNAPASNNRPGNSPAMSGRFNNTPATSQMTRQRELSQNRPPSAMTNSNQASASVAGNTASQRAGSSPRTWEAQGNATDRGRAPTGFGSSNRPTTTEPAQTARMSDTNRPPWARGGGQPAPSNGQSSRPSAPSVNGNRPGNSNNGRAYEPPQRSQPSYNNSRGYSQQPRSYSPPPSRSYSEPRTYSAPSRSYPAPSRSYSTPSYSAPSRSYSGGGGGGRSYSGGGGGGGSSHSSGGGGSSHSSGGGGGSSHGGGGSSSHGRH